MGKAGRDRTSRRACAGQAGWDESLCPERQAPPRTCCGGGIANPSTFTETHRGLPSACTLPRPTQGTLAPGGLWSGTQTQAADSTHTAAGCGHSPTLLHRAAKWCLHKARRPTPPLRPACPDTSVQAPQLCILPGLKTPNKGPPRALPPRYDILSEKLPGSSQPASCTPRSLSHNRPRTGEGVGGDARGGHSAHRRRLTGHGALLPRACSRPPAAVGPQGPRQRGTASAPTQAHMGSHRAQPWTRQQDEAGGVAACES